MLGWTADRAPGHFNRLRRAVSAVASACPALQYSVARRSRERRQVPSSAKTTGVQLTLRHQPDPQTTFSRQ